MRGDNGDAPRLARKTKELFVPSRLILSDRGKVLIFIAKKEDLAEVTLGMGFNDGNPIEDGPLKIELHHHTEGLGQSWIHRYWEIQSAHGRGEATVRPRRQGRRCVAFIGAKRKPLTEGADGSGAGFSQEGQ